MKKTFFLFLILSCISLSIAWINSDNHRIPTKHNAVKETGQNQVIDHSINNVPLKPFSVNVDSSHAVPTLSNWYDYRTNGQNPHGLWVFGDTVIIACDMTDSASAQTSTARNSYYQVSYDGGATWLPDAIQASTNGNAYPDLDPLVISGQRDVAFSGREFIAGVRTGYVAPDAQLGAGSTTSYLLNGQENFTMPLSSTTIAGGFESKTTDSLYFVKFDAVSNTYSGKLLLASTSDGINANSRSYTAASTSGKVAIAWWDATAGDMWVRTSTDGGTTFGTKVDAISSTGSVNGDPVCAWLAADICISPSGNVCLVNSTLEQGFFGTARGSKLLFWSPAINSGNPVVIADYHNAPTNCMLSDTNYYDAHYTSATDQVGMTALSHPSLAYSDDGSRLFCVYCVIQRDTASYGYFMNDIAESYSTDNGATWSSPVQLTNTASSDEIYPIISRNGNTASSIHVTYQMSGCPGSASFTNTATPVCRVFNVYNTFDPVSGNPIGITNISSQVPSKFTLSQNYPNPFNPTTKIRFALPNTENVTIKVYNIVGQVVSTLVNNTRVEAGTKEITFDASNYASGIYFYTIKAGDFTQTKKMVLIK